MLKGVDQQYQSAKNQSDDINDLIARLLFQLVGLQNNGNSGITQIITDGRKRYEHLNSEQNKFVEKIIENIREIVEKKEIDLSEITDGIGQVVEWLESSNLELREGFNALLTEYPETRKELAKIGQILSQNKPQELLFGEVIKSQEKGVANLGKLIVALTQEVKKKELPKEIKISGPVEISKPKWWQDFTFSWKPLDDIFEKLKKWTFSVKVENQLELKDFSNETAKKLSKELEKILPKLRSGGMGNPFTFGAGGALKVYSENEGGALESTLQDVLAQLQIINANTDGLEIKADSINLNTDALEELLVQIRDYVDMRTKPSDIQLGELIPVMRNILQAVANPSYVDKSANQMRAQATISSGTVTTVTTVTGLTNVDGYQGKLLVINQNIGSWANNVRARIS